MASSDPNSTRQQPGLRRRLKALLGTWVEISINAADEATFLSASDAAFARIAMIHRAMSFHEATSDVRALARAAAGAVLDISADTWQVLQLALAFEAASDAVFNVAVASTLVARGHLPRPDLAQTPHAATLAQGIELLGDHRVRLRDTLWIDVGGIAKGYAVDAAVAALQAAGITHGVVNAGGDLHAFGPVAHRLAVRHPARPGHNIEVASLCEMACATSGGYFLPVDADIDAASMQDTRALLRRDAIIGPMSLGANDCITAEPCASVSVIARDCVLADALTKVVWLRGAAASSLLTRYDAHALLVSPEGRLTRL